jgi:hypothetical protein
MGVAAGVGSIILTNLERWKRGAPCCLDKAHTVRCSTGNVYVVMCNDKYILVVVVVFDQEQVGIDTKNMNS